MTFSSALLPLVLLLASSSAWGMAHAEAGGLKQILMYMQAFTGPNATTLTVVPPLLGGNTTFGRIQFIDNELRDGPDPTNSLLIGRFQGFTANAGIVTPPGTQTVITFVFTAGQYSGSTLSMVGTIVSVNGTFERPIVGGTDKFRMARGYCIIKASSRPTPLSTVFEVNLSLKMEGN
ncbi:unnamed protein product [Alopecurus aequalis]